MKPLQTYTLLFVTLLFFSACRKDKNPLFDGVNCSGNCYILTGMLIDSAANTGLAKGEIKFYFRDNTGTFSNKRIYLGRTITDAFGNYTFKFDGSRFNNVPGYYYAEVYKGNFFADLSYRNRVAIFDLDASLYNLPFTQNFPMFRPATVKIRVIATTVTNFKFLTITYGYGKINNGIVFNGGRNIDTTFTLKTAGDLPTFFKWDAVGNGVNIQKRDTVLVPANSTGQIEIRL